MRTIELSREAFIELRDKLAGAGVRKGEAVPFFLAGIKFTVAPPAIEGARIIGQDQLALSRVDRATDNKAISPATLLRAMTALIESGEMPITQLLVIYRVDDGGKTFTQGRWRCGVTHDMELAMLQMELYLEASDLCDGTRRTFGSG